MQVDLRAAMAKARKRTESALPSERSLQASDSRTSAAVADPDSLDPRDRIAQRAYELYLARGGADGGDFDDWLAAEREIAAGHGNASRGDAGE